jgi:hypothetical protein
VQRPSAPQNKKKKKQEKWAESRKETKNLVSLLNNYENEIGKNRTQRKRKMKYTHIRIQGTVSKSNGQH